MSGRTVSLRICDKVPEYSFSSVGTYRINLSYDESPQNFDRQAVRSAALRWEGGEKHSYNTKLN